MFDRRSMLMMGAGLLAMPRSGFAQDSSDINRIIKGLAPIAGQTVATPPSPRNQRSVIIETQTIWIDVDRSLDFEVYFDTNRADLTAQAAVQLRALGQALASPDLAAYRYLVAGHTDGVGNAAHNLDLSRRRAASVRRFLLERHPIDPDRLMSTGFGFQHLKRPDLPRAAVNRRVEVVMIVS